MVMRVLSVVLKDVGSSSARPLPVGRRARPVQLRSEVDTCSRG